MNYRDKQLLASDFTTVAMPFATYCTLSDCQTLITPGTAAKRFDAATFAHLACPKTPHKNFAAHKQPNTNMVFNV